jgi:arabinogalactan endo-1,4-beta-galactosidase
MMAQGVVVDYPGLSYFPTSAKTGENSNAALLKQVRKIREALGKPVLICEYGYPSVAGFPGQFAEWNHSVEGYPLDEEGQQRWLRDFVELVRGEKAIAGAWYWSPEWYDSEMWQAFSLFRANGSPKPALKSFEKPQERQP